MSKARKPPIRVNTGGGAYVKGVVYVGGDFVGRDKITVFDATVIRWLALGTAFLLGLLVALVAYQLVGGGGSDQCLVVTVIHGAMGAVLGGLIAWYTPTLPTDPGLGVVGGRDG